MDQLKPHKGRISDWVKVEVSPYLQTHYSENLGYYIMGRYLDHPIFEGERGTNSLVVSYDETTGEIVTFNSRYTLVD